jgi:3-oxoacyl-[acyl-carrier-protein] synthase II
VRRVVVTGLGAVTPLGNTVEETWAAALAGKSGVAKIAHFDASSFASQIAGEVKNFKPEQWMSGRDAKFCDPFLQYAVAASTMALGDSGLLEDVSRGARTGTSVATAAGGMNVATDQHTVLVNKGARLVSPMLVPFSICDMASGYVSMMHKLEGPNHCLVSACASGASAIGEAYHTILRGSVEAMVAGASDSITPLHTAGFCSARALSTRNLEPERASRPFERSRDGFVIAEGSAVIVLEDLDQALGRDAKIYAELVGYGSCADAYHITSPEPTGRGAVRAMKEAMDMAKITPDQVGYVNAHATSTFTGDKIEVSALHQVFGPALPSTPVSGTKSMTGHMLGAAGAIEAIFCALALRDGVLPPTINLDDLDPDCQIDAIPNFAREQRIEYALSNSFGFGGHNVSLLFKTYP